MMTVESFAESVKLYAGGQSYDEKQYELFRSIINRLPVGNTKERLVVSSLNIKLGQIKGFEDISISVTNVGRLLKLIERYNAEDSNIFNIIVNDTGCYRYYYIIRKTPVSTISLAEKEHPCPDQVNSKSKYAPANPKLSRREYCISYVINKLVDLFKTNGDGYKFDHNDLVGKVHSEGNTEKYVSNAHIAEAKRMINSTPIVYQFAVCTNSILKAI